jgi:ligand-binding sensor domain-containing protein
MKTITLFTFILLVTASIQAQTVFWEQTNGPAGGELNCYLVADNGEMFISIHENSQEFAGGIFCSTDVGNSWEERSNGLPGRSCTGLIQNADGTLFTIDQGWGIYQSIDYGYNWELVTSSLSDAMSLAIDSSGIIFVGTEYQGIYRSLDIGATWEHLNSELDYWVQIVKIGPGCKIYAGKIDSGLYCSEDQGITWYHLGLAGKHIMSIDFDKDGNILACAIIEGLYRSSDNGVTWDFISEEVTTPAYYWGMSCNSSDHLFLATDGGLWRSLDDGLHWAHLNSVPWGREGWSNSAGNLFYSARESGIWKSIDDGLTWIQTGPALSSILSLSNFGANQVLAGADPLDGLGSMLYGVFSTENQGMYWSFTGLMYKFPYSLTTLGPIIIAGTENGIYRSLDSARTWTFAGLPNNVIKVVKATASGEIFAGTEGYGLYRSVNQGESWSFMGFPNMNVLSVASDETENLFAGTSDGIYYSQDEGINWAFSGLPNMNILSAVILDGGIIFAGTESGIYLSDDYGSNWEFKAFPDTTVYQLLTSDGNQIFAGTNNGVFRSINNGDTWENISFGLENLNVKALVIDSAGYLYAGVDYKGVYRSINKFVGLTEQNPLSEKAIKFEVFPNPLCRSTSLNYELIEDSFVNLLIYNHLGQEVAVLVNEQQQKGTHQVQWNSDLQPPGIYFYRLTVESRHSAISGKIVKY